MHNYSPFSCPALSLSLFLALCLGGSSRPRVGTWDGGLSGFLGCGVWRCRFTLKGVNSFTLLGRFLRLLIRGAEVSSQTIKISNKTQINKKCQTSTKPAVKTVSRVVVSQSTQLVLLSLTLMSVCCAAIGVLAARLSKLNVDQNEAQ